MSNTAQPTLRERLLAARVKPAGSYELAGLGVTVHLRRWSLADWLAFDAAAERTDSVPSWERLARMLALCLCDEANAPLFAVDAPELRTLAFGDEAHAIISATLEANGGGEKKPTPPQRCGTTGN